MASVSNIFILRSDLHPRAYLEENFHPEVADRISVPLTIFQKISYYILYYFNYMMCSDSLLLQFAYKAYQQQDFDKLCFIRSSLHQESSRLLLETEFKRYIREENSDMVEVLLNMGLNPDIRSDVPPLMIAVLTNNSELVERLLTAGARPHLRNSSGDTALTLAVRINNLAIVNQLADRRSSDRTKALRLAVEEEKLEIVDFLLETEVDVLEQDDDGNNVLMLSIMKGKKEIVESIVKKLASPPFDGGSIIPCTINHEGLSPLQLAAKHNYPEIVQLLLGCNFTEADKISAFFIASKEGHDEIFEMLSDVIDVNSYVTDVDESIFCIPGQTLLFCAVERSDLSAARKLIEKGADLNLKSRDGETPLMRASKKGNLDLVNLLLDAGAEVNIRSTTGETALMMAASIGNNFIVKRLLSAQASTLITNDDGENALIKAARNGDLPTVETLLNEKHEINASSSHGTALTIAIREEHELVVEKLLEKNADLNSRRTPNECTPLHMAVSTNNLKITKLLLSRSADPNIIYQDSPVTRAARNNNYDIVKALLDHRADPNLQSRSGATSLRFTKNAKITQLLLDHGADPEVTFENGQTILILSVLEKNKEMVKVLLDNNVNTEHRNNRGRKASELKTSKEISALFEEAKRNKKARQNEVEKFFREFSIEEHEDGSISRLPLDVVKNIIFPMMSSSLQTDHIEKTT